MITLEQIEAPLAEDRARAIDGVRVAHTLGRTLRVGTDDPDRVMGALVRACERDGVVTGRIARSPATLEDVFLVLSGRSLSDAS